MSGPLNARLFGGHDDHLDLVARNVSTRYAVIFADGAIGLLLSTAAVAIWTVGQRIALFPMVVASGAVQRQDRLQLILQQGTRLSLALARTRVYRAHHHGRSAHRVVGGSGVLGRRLRGTRAARSCAVRGRGRLGQPDSRGGDSSAVKLRSRQRLCFSPRRVDGSSCQLSIAVRTPGARRRRNESACARRTSRGDVVNGIVS